MILLRKQADELLKEAGFDERLTVSRIDKYVYIVGQCGKPVMRVSDLEAGNKLTKVERNIIIEDYLIPLLDKKDLVNAYISLEDSIREQNEMFEETVQKLNIRITFGYYNTDVTFYSTYSEEGVKKLEVSINGKPSVKDILISTNSVTFDVLQTLLSTKYKGMVENLEIVKNMYIRREETKKEQAKLQKELGLVC